MLFNSHVYIFGFLPAALLVYFVLNHAARPLAAKAWLVAASLFFYGWWNPRYVPLIVGSIAFNFWTGRALNLDRFTNAKLPQLNATLPLGISFFTFTQIAYLVDAYRGEVRETNPLSYVLFVTFFPHLIAGPILHHKEMMPQFDEGGRKLFDPRNVSIGLYVFFIGLFKKAVAADTFALWAGNGFDRVTHLTLIDGWITSISYSLQLYFDFSGYTDMALGSALMFNIVLPQNFASPYQALSIQDFWRRWHMTLSRFLKGYVYIPLGGSRGSELLTRRNLLITFALGGIWHGAGWTFLPWGLLHGGALVAHRWWSRVGFRLPRPLAWLTTFMFVNFAWVFFRAHTWSDAVKVLRGMAGLNGIELPNKARVVAGFLHGYGVAFGDCLGKLGADRYTLLVLALFLLVALVAPSSYRLGKAFRPDLRHALACMALTAYGLASIAGVSEFLYFDF